MTFKTEKLASGAIVKHEKVARKPEAIDPSHYASLNPEPITVIEAWKLNFNEGNALAYIARAGKKLGQTKFDDLIKAANYLYREATGEWLPKELLKKHER